MARPEQVTGELKLDRGAEIQLRCFGRFNLTLWDDVMEEFGTLTKRDIIMVNFGAWYHRFFFAGGPDEWIAWKDDVHELLFERLANTEAQVPLFFPFQLRFPNSITRVSLAVIFFYWTAVLPRCSALTLIAL